MEQRGLTNWREYFHPRKDGVREVAGEGSRAPVVADEADYGWQEGGAWDLPEEFHRAAWTGQRTIAAINDARARGVPFFIWSSHHDPHPPCSVPEPWASLYDPADMDVGRFVKCEFDGMPPPHGMTRRAGEDFEEFCGDGMGSHGYHVHKGKTEAEMRRAQATCYGTISFMDHWIGRILDRLEALGSLEETLIVFTLDQGHVVGEHGLIARGRFTTRT